MAICQYSRKFKAFFILCLVATTGCITTHVQEHGLKKDDPRNIAASSASFVFPKKKCRGAPTIPDQLTNRTISEYQTKLRRSLFELAKIEDLTKEDIQCLESIGAQKDARDDIGNTPLHYAIAHDNINAVFMFLYYSPDWHNVSNREGKTAKDYIEIFDRSSVYSVVLRASQNNSLESLASEIAKHAQHENLLYFIDELGVDVNIPGTTAEEDTGDNGLTALMQIAKQGTCNMIQPLIQRSADINLQSSKGNTALMFAIKYNKPDCAQPLVENDSINLALQNQEGQTALMLAIQHNTNGNMNSVISELVSEQRCVTISRRTNCKLDVQDKNLDTALHYAAKLGDSHTANILFDNKADGKLENDQGDTAKDIAIREGHQDIVSSYPSFWKNLTKGIVESITQPVSE